MGRQLRRFTDEQIERANRVDVVEYARSVGLQIERNGVWFKAKKQGGLYFHKEGNTWHWETRDAGGVGAISLCMEYENKTYVEAVKTLLNEDMEPIRHAPDWKPEPEPPKEFHLPQKNNTYRHVFAYLTKTRGIDPGILKVLVDRGYIYENTQRSCVFVGRDNKGVPRHASVRSTNTNGKVFKQDVPGSQKSFSFSISGSSKILNVFEAPIDALSYLSLQKFYGKQMKDSYISLGGVTDKALERYLNDHKDIERIRICTDNDTYLNPVWKEKSQGVETSETVMSIEKSNKVKETDNSILFRTYSDYSRFIAKDMEAAAKYIAFPKDQMALSNEGIYTINIAGDQEYVLYNSVNDHVKGIGTRISGRQLYNEHFLKLPAGERAAFSIYEKYGDKYKITRHRPIHKDFNEDLVAIRKQEQSKEYKKDNQLVTGNKEIQSEKQELHDSVQSQAVTEQKPEGFFIKGKCEVLVLCDNQEEIQAYRDVEAKRYKAMTNADCELDEYYLEYRNVNQVKTFIEQNPDIKTIWVCTSRTDSGRQAAKEVMQTFDSMNCERYVPNLDKYSEDLAEMNTLVAALADTALEELQQIDMVAGMEM